MTNQADTLSYNGEHSDKTVSLGVGQRDRFAPDLLRTESFREGRNGGK